MTQRPILAQLTTAQPIAAHLTAAHLTAAHLTAAHLTAARQIAAHLTEVLLMEVAAILHPAAVLQLAQWTLKMEAILTHPMWTTTDL